MVLLKPYLVQVSPVQENRLLHSFIDMKMEYIRIEKRYCCYEAGSSTAIPFCNHGVRGIKVLKNLTCELDRLLVPFHT